MSETTPHTPQNNDTCELLLDYVYGELDEARKRTFEEHLPGCARCQQEVASFGRVRTAAKRMMPSVEPTAPLAGALHTQLMHAAAQRKPRRGVLLAFPRKIMQHPALSAAAMFALVGGAIAINWSRGKMAMPAAEQTVDAPKPTEVATATLKAPAGEPALVPEPKAKEKEQAEAKPDEHLAQGTKNEESFKGGADKAAASAGDQTKIALETPSGRLDVQRPVAHRATPSPKKEAPPAKMKSIAIDGKSGKLDSSLDDSLAAAPKDEAGRAGLTNGVVGGAGTGATSGGGGRFADAENAKSSAPQELDRNKVAEKAPARDLAKQHGYAAGAPAPSTPQSSTSTGQSQYRGSNNAPAAAPPPPTVAATAPASEREGGYYTRSQPQPTTVMVQKPAAQPRNYDSVRKNADEWAKTGRCDDAIKMYKELEKANQHISPTERANWSRCLMQQGRQEEAQQQLDDLKTEKNQLNDSRRRVESKKASKKAPAAADRAPAVETQQQRRAAEPAPAQASPPDSTNTKVKSPTY
ncbi:MAG: zf-HC2 domain-containing protein [Polyangia bacterium]